MTGWQREAEAAGIAFVPAVNPGYDARLVRPNAETPIPGGPNTFQAQLESALDLYRYVIATCVEYDTEEYSSKLKQDFMDSVTLLEEVLEAAE